MYLTFSKDTSRKKPPNQNKTRNRWEQWEGQWGFKSLVLCGFLSSPEWKERSWRQCVCLYGGWGPLLLWCVRAISVWAWEMNTEILCIFFSYWCRNSGNILTEADFLFTTRSAVLRPWKILFPKRTGSINGPGRFTTFQGTKRPRRNNDWAHGVDNFFPDHLRSH